jgi:fatty-acyl-CoA synthase
LRDVVAPGDRWLRSFTLMRWQADGFVFPAGPAGDVLRWRGENVATAEIAAALALCPGVAAAIVYGVMVPGREGRAPMAALVPDQSFDLATLHARLARDLPAYARPLVLRVLPAQAPISGRRRALLAREGFDPAANSDPLYVDDGSGFVPLDRARHARLVAGPGGMETGK